MVPAVDKATPCYKVAELFRSHEGVLGFAVIDGQTPVGIIAREALTIRLSLQFGYAVYGKREVTELMDVEPLLVDVAEDVDAVECKIADEHSAALVSGFIIVENGKYLGMGTALSLLRNNIKRTRLRNNRLEQATAAAEQANLMKSQFLANMSHEFRTPLNAIIGFSELMVTEAFGPMEPSKYKDYSGDILESGRHLLSLINDILDMSKIEAGRYVLQTQPVDIERLIFSAVKMCKPLADQKNIELATEFQANGAVVTGDERAIKQMVLNLVSNAVKYTPRGGHVDVRLDGVETGGIVVSITDTGIGISAEDMEKVLEPFSQAASKMNNKTEGTGLGLAIVNALARLHGADFKLASTVGVGTEAAISFPATAMVSLQEWSAA